MTTNRFTDDDLVRMLRTRADRVAPDGIREDLVAAILRERAQRRRIPARGRPSGGVLLVAAALLAGTALAASLVAGAGRTSPVQPSADVGTSEPVARRIVCGNADGIWELELVSADPAPATVLGCSRDGTKILIQKGDENLFVVHADGSEVQVTDQLSGFSRILGSARPSGATISPDGSRIVFAGLTKREAGRSCHDGALFAVHAEGGPADLLFASRSTHNGIVRDPAFSPDGAYLAFVDGYCDSDHSVWVMNADGSEAHQIVTAEDAPLGGTHVHGLAWSPAGDRIALLIDQGIYTFAPDGSDIAASGSGSEFCWPGQEC